ncbi:MAG: phosphoribosylformylglycinamidine synthase subunit PurL [Lewinellaceae bacterium]|nr:phosphoribosylformylglycinamidine synthase subunit PurL [Lewinellaceae bacterium]
MQATEPHITVEVANKLGLSSEEYQSILKAMERTPSFTELCIYAAMLPEARAYSNAVQWLKALPHAGVALSAGPGTGAVGSVDMGNGWACVFKAGQNNYLSSIEPYLGAVSAMGNMHQDIVATGARPVAALYALRLGDIERSSTRKLLRGIIKGIGDYSNNIGVPAVGGGAFFYDCYNEGIVANMMSAGLVWIGETVQAKAPKAGSPVFIVGQPTGKDGANNTALATANLVDEPGGMTPAVQVGAPFYERLLLEATQEALLLGVITAMQSLGAAGLARAAALMCTRFRMGMHIELSKVPTRQGGLKAFEILLSESPERMLAIGVNGRESECYEVFEKWGLACEQIGELNSNGILKCYHHRECVTELEASALVSGGGTPVHQPELAKPEYLSKVARYKLSHIPKPDSYIEAAWKLFSSPNVVSRHWAFEQCDTMAGIDNMSAIGPSDAALLRIKGSRSALAAAMRGNAAYAFADPYTGALIAVAEAARNIVCSGGEPLALTHCLNFGGSSGAELYWQFVMAVKGIGEACKKLNIPVSGGEATFDTIPKKGAPYPAPIIGMAGMLEDVSTQMTLDFKAPGHQIYMIGTPHNDLGSSEYLRHVHGIQYAPAPVFDLDEEYQVQLNMKRLIRKNLIESAHNISEGGLFVALLESAMPRGLGFTAETDTNFRKDAYLFGENQSRILVTVTQESEDELVNYLNAQNVSFTKIGEVAGSHILIDEEDYGSVADWAKAYGQASAATMEV